MKKVLLIGHQGNMGRRYASILDYLGIKWAGIEYYNRIPDSTDADGIIIATPTKSHLADIALYSRFKLPMLCEKPVVTSEADLETLNIIDMNLSVVNQYAQYEKAVFSSGDTFVDYYNTGNDGIVWDCINLIGLSTQNVYLKNQSPIWSIILNGEPLARSFVDIAYIEMIKSWCFNPVDGRKYIYASTKRVLDYEKNKGRGRYSGEEIFVETT